MSKNSVYKTAKEIAETYGVTRQHITNLAENGKIPAMKLGSHWRFLPEEVEAAFRAAAERRPTLPNKK